MPRNQDIQTKYHNWIEVIELEGHSDSHVEISEKIGLTEISWLNQPAYVVNEYYYFAWKQGISLPIQM